MREETVSFDVETFATHHTEMRLEGPPVEAERRLGLFATCRAEDHTGADWYVASSDYVADTEVPNLDHPSVRRLEVGGHDDRPSLQYELDQKVRQIRAGASDKIGIAAVVGFQKAKILIETDVAPEQTKEEGR